MSQPGDEPADEPDDNEEDATPSPPSAGDEKDFGGLVSPSLREAMNELAASLGPDLSGVVSPSMRELLDGLTGLDPSALVSLNTRELLDGLTGLDPSALVSPNTRELLDGLTGLDPSALVTPAMRESLSAVFAAYGPNLRQLVLGPDAAVGQTWAAQMAGFTTLATMPPSPVVNRALAAQFDSIVGRLHTPVNGSSETLADLFADVSDALDSSTPETEAGGCTRTQPDVEPTEEAGDEFVSALNGFIAVGLASKDLVVTSWLLTIRQVDQVRGRAAAKRALAIFIGVGFTWVWAGWLVNNGDKVPDAFAIALGLTLGLTGLLALWKQLGGE